MKKKLLLQRYSLCHSKKSRRYWVHPINRRRHQLGIYNQLVQELRCDNQRHLKYLRMSKENFDELLLLVTPYIKKQDTHLRESILPGLKLAATLHYLAEGSSFISIAYHYRIGRSTAASIIYETCAALWAVLQPLYLKAPCGPTEWIDVSKG